uniref:Uncharacterized protein n=1 Tax=Lepeophtheirus salmonis TaxID=72036 RepID=A0A0K2UFP4_LEPSM
MLELGRHERRLQLQRVSGASAVAWKPYLLINATTFMIKRAQTHMCSDFNGSFSNLVSNYQQMLYRCDYLLFTSVPIVTLRSETFLYLSPSLSLSLLLFSLCLMLHPFSLSLFFYD